MIKLSFNRVEYLTFMFFISRIKEAPISDPWQKSVSVEVCKQMFLRLSKRQYQLKAQKNQVNISIVEALFLQRIMMLIPTNDPWEIAVVNLIEPKIREVCSQENF